MLLGQTIIISWITETKTKVICQKAKSFLVSIRQVAAVIRNCVFWLMVRPQNLPFPGALGIRDPHLTQCVPGAHKCTCHMASKSVGRFKQGRGKGRFVGQTVKPQPKHAIANCSQTATPMLPPGENIQGLG